MTSEYDEAITVVVSSERFAAMKQQAQDDGVRYDRRERDVPGEDNLPPHDYPEPEGRWFLLDRRGNVVNQEGNAFGNWLARMLHGVIWMYCEVRHGKPVFPGRFKR